jgi:hypothetical protein
MKQEVLLNYHIRLELVVVSDMFGYVTDIIWVKTSLEVFESPISPDKQV